jgi:hypothetical protein
MTHYLRNIFTSSALLVMFSATCALGASVTFTPSGSGSYLIMGSNMDGVAGIQLNVTYDAASLATPTVTQGGLVSGAMLAANTTQPGIIKIAIISTRTFSGSGQIAAISFASKNGSGGITSITADMIDSKGSAIASSGSNPSGEAAATEFTTTAGIPFSQSSTATTASTASTTAAITATTAAATTSTYPGTITLPTDLQKQTDSQPAPSSTVPAPSEEPAVSEISEQTKPSDKPASDSKVGETAQFVVYKGVLEQFKLYNGSKSLSSIVTLFDKKIAQNIHQEPAILLSDGLGKATLTVDISSKTGSSPNFAVNGGKLLSFKQDMLSAGHWKSEVLPETGTVRTTITIIAGAEDFEFPLTVAPPVKTMLTLDEPGWNRFLKEVGTAQTPLHDLNNDGVRNYVDEFIFIANYLAKKATPLKAVSTPNKSVK